MPKISKSESGYVRGARQWQFVFERIEQFFLYRYIDSILWWWLCRLLTTTSKQFNQRNLLLLVFSCALFSSSPRFVPFRSLPSKFYFKVTSTVNGCERMRGMLQSVRRTYIFDRRKIPFARTPFSLRANLKAVNGVLLAFLDAIKSWPAFHFRLCTQFHIANYFQSFWPNVDKKFCQKASEEKDKFAP